MQCFHFPKCNVVSGRQHLFSQKLCLLQGCLNDSLTRFNVSQRSPTVFHTKFSPLLASRNDYKMDGLLALLPREQFVVDIQREFQIVFHKNQTDGPFSRLPQSVLCDGWLPLLNQFCFLAKLF